MAKFTRRVIEEKDDGPPAPLVISAVENLERDYKADKSKLGVKADTALTKTPAVLLHVCKATKEGEDGSCHVLELHTWSNFSRLHLIHQKRPGLSRVVAQFDLGMDNGDFSKRREYLAWLAKALPGMLLGVAEAAEEGGY